MSDNNTTDDKKPFTFFKGNCTGDCDECQEECIMQEHLF